jgi:hypothetical protein
MPRRQSTGLARLRAKNRTREGTACAGEVTGTSAELRKGAGFQSWVLLEGKERLHSGRGIGAGASVRVG